MDRLERIHLDLIGGIAGDMFVAAVTDAFPELVPGLLEELRKLPAPAESSIDVVGFSDGVLCGRRFVVKPDGPYMPQHVHGGDAPSHGHIRHCDIQQQLREAGLDADVLRHALQLFDLLAEAEASVHGVGRAEVEFHEVGAWDSIVDFVAVACLIAKLGTNRWTWSPPPLGGGRVRTAHGIFPVPSPATAYLLRGMEVIDDGVTGERVTPTGAAILKHLAGLTAADGPDRGSIAATGHGFGTKRLPGMPNVLRCVAFAHVPAMPAPLDEEIATLQFEIDDQSAEDLAVALDRIRATEGVLEVYQIAAYGKKGRLATQVQVLARLEAADRVADVCLSQTTTLGLRLTRVWRRTLMRAGVGTCVSDSVRVKLAARPSGQLTAKAEMDDLARVAGGRTEREHVRELAEREALRRADVDGGTRKDD